jgi:hypothetical protein
VVSAAGVAGCSSSRECRARDRRLSTFAGFRAGRRSWSIPGRAWCGRDGQEPWTFTLLLDPSVEAPDTPDAIDWGTLLPGEHVTGWLTPYPEDKAMKIDPSSAYPD